MDKLVKEQQKVDITLDDSVALKSEIEQQQSTKSSWFLGWRRSASQQPPAKVQKDMTINDTNSAVATQTSRANSPDDGSLIQNSEKSKNDSFNMSNSLEDASESIKIVVPEKEINNISSQHMHTNEKYRKTLRLSSSQIVRIFHFSARIFY